MSDFTFTLHTRLYIYLKKIPSVILMLKSDIFIASDLTFFTFHRQTFLKPFSLTLLKDASVLLDVLNPICSVVGLCAITCRFSSAKNSIVCLCSSRLTLKA